MLAQYHQFLVGQATGHRFRLGAVIAQRGHLDHTGGALAVFAGKVDRHMVFLGDLEDGLGVRASHRIDGLVLVDRAGESDIGHEKLRYG
ncbi:hypothetical protein SDC9_171670 [bioreactor metagenome]|uniref:Uncharacterized protein n=1 Tax=bioreactor metagenome TaxID=1076179 RepID=A0A645GC83_9ZZZZ